MPVDVKYVGCDIPNEFVVGYGLDYAERYRNLRASAPSPRTSTPEPRRPGATERGHSRRGDNGDGTGDAGSFVGIRVYRRCVVWSELAGGRGERPGTWT